MRWFFLLIVVGLFLGPFGQLSQSVQLIPSLFVVFLWALSWFYGRNQTLSVAIGGGLLLDLTGWNWFGFWIINALAVVLVVSALKERLLDASSILHALLALTVASLITPLLLSAATRTFAVREIALTVLSNLTLGALVYYILATRLRMFQRWAGRRIG